MLEPVAASARLSLRMSADVAGEIGAPDFASFDLAHLDFTIPVSRCSSRDGWTAARLGPDEWRLLGPASALDAMTRALTGALGERFFSLVDISHRDEGFWVAGIVARDILNGGCPLDLADAAFPAGAATRTIFGKTEIVLLRMSAEARFRIECGRSFAPYVGAFLAELAREF